MKFRTVSEDDGYGIKHERVDCEFVNEIWIEGASEMRFGFNLSELSIDSCVRRQKTFLAAIKNGENVSGLMELEFVGVFKSQVVYRASRLYPADDLYRFEMPPTLLSWSSPQANSSLGR